MNHNLNLFYKALNLSAPKNQSTFFSRTLVVLLLLVSLIAQWTHAQDGFPAGIPGYNPDVIELETGATVEPESREAPTSAATQLWLGFTTRLDKLSKRNKIILGGCIGACLVATIVVVSVAAVHTKGPEMAPQNFQRGMYVSIWSNTIAPQQNARYGLALDNSTKVQHVFDLIGKEKIDSLTLYDVPAILDTVGMPEKLSNFITAAKQSGIREVYTAGSKNYDYEAMRDFQSKYPNQIDGIVTEVEFWKVPGDQKAQAFNDYLSQLKYMRSLNIQSGGQPVKIGTYLASLSSVPNLSELDVANAIMPLVDRVMQPCYGQTVEESYSECRRRIDLLMQTNKNVEIVPMVSAESRNFSGFGGENWFLGDYIRKNPNLAPLENYFQSRYASDYPSNKVRGFYYFEFTYMDYVVN
jgi:hypothetical protein